ncbi:MAG: hypothetical protein GX117_01855 [Candidatus Hydrogenedentes bacterium]|nr:hypothetical protein [Candidatus Hydrogenedentota bacterium]
MKKFRSKESGMALLLALICIVVVLGGVMLVGRMLVSSHANTDLVTAMRLAEESAKSGIDIAVERVWNQYVLYNDNVVGNLGSYKRFINRVVARDQAIDIVVPSDPVHLDTSVAATVEAVRLLRTDTPDGVMFTIFSTGTYGEQRCEVEQSMRVSGALFNGYEYAVLANYINCILCHASFYNLDERMNKDRTKYGSFDRIKIATLEALLYRTTSADSVVAGTIYTRGQVYNEAYVPMSSSTIEKSDFQHFQFSKEHGGLTQQSNGALVRQGLKEAKIDRNTGKLEQYASLYTNYPTEQSQMTDGVLPKEFPAPYPDDNGNRYIEDEEYEQVAELLVGSIEGGVVYGVPKNGQYTQTSMPSSSNNAASVVASTGRYDGNLILVGTDANPIRLDGQVAVNGDLMMAGKVVGWGEIFVRGNSYITGDVTYKDGSQFGVAADGTKNGLSVITGGSVLMGDYLTIRGKNHSADTAKFPNSADSINVRVQTSTVNRKVGKTTETLDRGYFSPGVADAGEISTYTVDSKGKQVKRQGQQFSFTQSELQLFNNLELEKALADPAYRPRFYGIRDSQPNNIYVYTKISEEHAVRYDEPGGNVKTLSARLTQLGIRPNTILDRSSFHYMNPTNNWISEDTLRHLWWNDEMARPKNSPWKFDGLLYSNNAIFAITRSGVRHNSNSGGAMEVRGAIVCPDIGVLVAGTDQKGCESFKLFYDQRVNEFWSPQDTTRTFLHRLSYRRVTG